MKGNRQGAKNAKEGGNGQRRVLALDPSSTAVGYAVLDADSGSLLDSGVCRPMKATADATARIADLCCDVQSLVRNWLPHAIVIEIPSAHQGTGSRAGATGRLAIYGMAVGAVWITALATAELLQLKAVFELVTERQWTKGVPKTKRAAKIRMKFPTYARSAKADKGLDVADAIGIGSWYIAAVPRRYAAAGDQEIKRSRDQEGVKGSRGQGAKGAWRHPRSSLGPSNPRPLGP